MARKTFSRAQVDAAIRLVQSACKRKPGDKPFAEEWAEYKREEKELGERKFQRLATRNSKRSKKNQNQLACEISGWQDQTNSPAQPDDLK